MTNIECFLLSAARIYLSRTLANSPLTRTRPEGTLLVTHLYARQDYESRVLVNWMILFFDFLLWLGASTLFFLSDQWHYISCCQMHLLHRFLVWQEGKVTCQARRNRHSETGESVCCEADENLRVTWGSESEKHKRKNNRKEQVEKGGSRTCFMGATFTPVP